MRRPDSTAGLPFSTACRLLRRLPYGIQYIRQAVWTAYCLSYVYRSRYMQDDRMNESMGAVIAGRRKALSMTQAELAGKLNVTDKAVSKWERNVSCPDIALLPRLAAVLGISVEELLAPSALLPRRDRRQPLAELVCTAVALALGVAVTVLCALSRLDLLRNGGRLDTGDMLLFCGAGIALLAFTLIMRSGDD